MALLLLRAKIGTSVPGKPCAFWPQRSGGVCIDFFDSDVGAGAISVCAARPVAKLVSRSAVDAPGLTRHGEVLFP